MKKLLEERGYIMTKEEKIALYKNKICPTCGKTVNVKDIKKEGFFYKYYKCDNCGYEKEVFQQGFV